MTTEFTWTHERVDELRRLICTEHLSASQAAISMNITKNMVISKCGRAGITIPRRFLRPFEIEEIKNSTESCRVLARRFGVCDSCVSRVRSSVTHRRARWKPAEPTPNPFPADARSCLWPHGHPNEPGFHFCGGYRMPGKPYCSMHAAVAYQRPTDKVPA